MAKINHQNWRQHSLPNSEACPAEVFKRRRILSPQGSFGGIIIAKSNLK